MACQKASFRAFWDVVDVDDVIIVVTAAVFVSFTGCEALSLIVLFLKSAIEYWKSSSNQQS